MNTLTQWTEQDLTARARAGKLPAAFDADESLQAVIDQIEGARHPILTGPAGIGKTAIVYELVRRVTRGDGPRRLAGRQFLQMSFQRRLGTLEHRYQIGEEMSKLVELLRRMRRPPVLFIRDIHLADHCNLEDQLAAIAYGTDAIVIGEGPDVAVADLLEYTPLLQQAYTRVPLAEPSLDRARRMLAGWSQDTTRQHRCLFATDAVEQALMLTYRFQPRSCLPRKAIDLLSQSAGRSLANGEVSADAVVARFCALYRIPRVLVDPTLPLDLERVRRRFAGAVFGQTEAVNAIVDTVAMLKAGLSDVRRPLAAILLVGPTGVGKTYIAQLLAELLFGDRDRMVRINMAEFKSEGDVARLFGNAPNRKANQNEDPGRGVLATQLAGYPFGVVLLDEFEKSAPAVHDHLLQLIDEGVFVNGESETVSCRSLIFVATSNAGHEHQTPGPFGFAGDDANGNASALCGLEKHFRFELLNRFDRIIRFAPLGVDDARSIVLAELKRIGRRTGMRQRQLELEVETAVVDWVVTNGFDEARGARYLRHTLEHTVTTALARLIASENPATGSRIRLTLRNGAVVATLANPKKETPAHAAQSPAPEAQPPTTKTPRRLPLPLSWRKRPVLNQ